MIGLEIRVGFGQGEKGAQGLGQEAFDFGPFFQASVKVDGPLTGLGDGFQGLPFMPGIPLNRFDEVGDEVVAAFKLDVDRAPGAFHIVSAPNQAVVNPDNIKAQTGYPDDQNR